MPIVWQQADGSLILTQLADSFLKENRLPDETTTEAVLRLASSAVQPKDPSLAGLTPVLVATAGIPASRGKRLGWRLNGSTVVEDDVAFQAAIAANQARMFDEQKLVKAVAIWAAQKLGVPLARARSEILAIYKAL